MLAATGSGAWATCASSSSARSRENVLEPDLDGVLLHLKLRSPPVPTIALLIQTMYHLIDPEQLAIMKEEAVLVNTNRGRGAPEGEPNGYSTWVAEMKNTVAVPHIEKASKLLLFNYQYIELHPSVIR